MKWHSLNGPAFLIFPESRKMGGIKQYFIMLMYFVGHEFRRDTAEIACFCFTMSEVSAREGLNNWAWIKPHWRLQPSGGFSTYMSGPWAEMTWKFGSDSSTNQSPTHGLSKWLEHGGRWVVRLLRWWLWAYECTFQPKRRKTHGLLRPSLGNHRVSLLLILLLNPVRKPPRFKWRTIPWPGGGSKNSSHALKQPKEEWFSSQSLVTSIVDKAEIGYSLLPWGLYLMRIQFFSLNMW